MKKIINPGKVQIGKRRYNVFCEIEFDKGRLAISGVIGPRANGNCAYGNGGGCGQIVNNLKNICSVNDDWTFEMISKLTEIWKEWHLKNLREVPADVIDWLFNLPNTKETPAWI